MKTNRIHAVTFDTDETIVDSAISKPNEIVMLMSSGDVIRFDVGELKGEFLFSVKSNIIYADGGFDLTAKTSIYTLDEIVVVVNDFRRHGIVHYPDKYHALHLSRGDYYADISVYPIALYKNENGTPHLIFGEDWNHIQIMNLDTRQVLTATKSLIEENAEERHIELYQKYPEDNKLPWPHRYDYFFGKLHVSPDQKKFMSAGWVWGSYDCYNVYNIEQFISSNRISDLTIGSWEHANRATCWIDDETIAIAYNPYAEHDENSTPDSPSEIHFYRINGDTVEIEKKVQVADKNLVGSAMFFNKTMNSFITFSDKDGLSIISLDGQVLLKDENFKVSGYSIETGLILVSDDKTVMLYEIEK